MSITLTANYKETLSTATVEKIDELLEDNYALDDILEFIDQYSEEDFVSYYEAYVDQGEEIGYDVVDAFINENGIDNVEHAQDAYRGQYDSEADFAEEFTTEIHGEMPSFVVIDWQATWDTNLTYDFDFVDGFVFDRNF